MMTQHLWSVWIEGEGGGVEQSRADLVQNQLIFSLHYSTPLHSPSFPPPSKQAISKTLLRFFPIYRSVSIVMSHYEAWAGSHLHLVAHAESGFGQLEMAPGPALLVVFLSCSWLMSEIYIQPQKKVSPASIQCIVLYSSSKH